VATYVDAATGHVFDFAAEGFTGEASIVHTATTGAVTPGNGTLQARDFCGAVSRCHRAVASTATAGAIFVANAFTHTCVSLGAATRDTFRREGYVNRNAVLQGAVVEFAVNFISVPIGNAWVNSLNKKGGGGSDSCALNDREVLAANFGASLNFFRQRFAQAKKAETSSHMHHGDMNWSESVNRGVLGSAGEYCRACGGVCWDLQGDGGGVEEEGCEWGARRGGVVGALGDDGRQDICIAPDPEQGSSMAASCNVGDSHQGPTL
jgi:hypothetical protein